MSPAEPREEAIAGNNSVVASAGFSGGEGGAELSTPGANGLGANAADGGSGAGAAGRGGRGPILMAFANPCAGYFPSGAAVRHGEVEVEVEVGEDGRTAHTRVQVESPRGEGFASAARACASHLRFTPAQSEGGVAVRGRARLRLNFDRS